MRCRAFDAELVLIAVGGQSCVLASLMRQMVRRHLLKLLASDVSGKGPCLHSQLAHLHAVDLRSCEG